MKKTNELFKKLLEHRNRNEIDPFNFGLLKYTSWEASLNARLKENASDVTPKVMEIISSVVHEFMDEEDLEKIAELQTRLTEKYSDRLVELDNEINDRVQEYMELYNEAVRRVMESQQEGHGGSSEENTN